ncbi:MAG: serine hydrolase, partial [Bifidobacterium longum]|nr:serine hydrolase [Bifidobacterium longum]
MNKYLRQLFTAVVALFVILGLSSTIIMAVRANALNNDPRNARSLYHQLGAYRGAILASDGTVMAKSEPVNDAFKYLRTYSNGPLYAPVTGFFSINQTADRGLEASRSMLLNGEADSLIWQRAKAMLTGATNQGASIETSIDPKLQQVAYDQLGTRDGAAVAIEVSQNSPLINRATSQLYPPGSTFKTIVASAALETGEYQTDTKIPAGAGYTLPGTATQLPNDEHQADGVNGQISLQEAVAWSSNTAFAQLGVKLGASKVSDMATKLGFGSTITIDGTESTGTPMTATASTFPSDPTDDKLA